MFPDTISTPQGLLVCIPCACAVQWFKLLIAALKCFKAQVFDPIKDRVRAAMLDLIHNEREGDSVDHRLLKAIVSVPRQTTVLPGSMALILLYIRFSVKWDSATTSIRLQMVWPNQKSPFHAIRSVLLSHKASTEICRGL